MATHNQIASLERTLRNTNALLNDRICAALLLGYRVHRKTTGCRQHKRLSHVVFWQPNTDRRIRIFQQAEARVTNGRST